MHIKHEPAAVGNGTYSNAQIVYGGLHRQFHRLKKAKVLRRWNLNVKVEGRKQRRRAHLPPALRGKEAADTCAKLRDAGQRIVEHVAQGLEDKIQGRLKVLKGIGKRLRDGSAHLSITHERPQSVHGFRAEITIR